MEEMERNGSVDTTVGMCGLLGSGSGEEVVCCFEVWEFGF